MANPRAIGIALRDRVSGRIVGYALGSALENHDEEGVSSDPHFGDNNTFFLQAMATQPAVRNASELENLLLESIRARAIEAGFEFLSTMIEERVRETGPAWLAGRRCSSAWRTTCAAASSSPTCRRSRGSAGPFRGAARRRVASAGGADARQACAPAMRVQPERRERVRRRGGRELWSFYTAKTDRARVPSSSGAFRRVSRDRDGAVVALNSTGGSRWLPKIAALRRWTGTSSARLPARAARPRTRRAPRTSGRARKLRRPAAKAGWRAITSRRTSCAADSFVPPRRRDPRRRSQPR